MIVIREMVYFMFALILLCTLMCLLIWMGWLLNTLCKELLDIDIVSILKWRKHRAGVHINKKGERNETF